VMTRARQLSKLGNPNVFTVDTDLNVGVNSTSPTEKLNVVGVVSEGVSTSKQLTIGVRVGAAVTFEVVGAGFTVDGRSAAITIDV